jgi:hypothetical protein
LSTDRVGAFDEICALAIDLAWLRSLWLRPTSLAIAATDPLANAVPPVATTSASTAVANAGDGGRL